MTKSADPSILALAQSNSVLGRLSPSTLEDLLDRGEVLDLGPDQALVKQGDPSDSAYLILDGGLDIQVDTAYGQVHLARISRGALIGEIGVFADLPRTATVHTHSAVRALKFDRALLLRAGDNDPALLRSVIMGLGRQVGNFNHAIGLYTNALSALGATISICGFSMSFCIDPGDRELCQSFRRMAEQIVLRRTQHEEMASAAAIQRAMLPSALPAAFVQGRFEIHAEMRPAREVGGDLYDILRSTRTAWWLRSAMSRAKACQPLCSWP